MKNLEEYIQRLNKYDWVPEKGKTCLLLIDLQEYFRGMISSILPDLQRMLSATRKMKIPVIFTQHGHEASEDPGMLGTWWGDLIIKGSSDAPLLPELEVGSKETVIQKNRYSAFYETELEKKLKENNIKDLVIGGVMTNLCCETTARDAFVRDYRVFFLADGTSTGEKELYVAALENLAFGFATLLTCGQFIKIIKNWKT